MSLPSSQKGQSFLPSGASHITPAIRAQIVEVFRLFDTGSVGFMDIRELRVALRVMGMEVTKEEDAVITMIHRTDDHRLSESSFVDIVADRIAERGPQRLRQTLEDGFGLFDKDGYGTLTTRALQQVCREIGDTDVEQLDKVFINLVGSTSMSKDEFVELLSRRGF